MIRNKKKTRLIILFISITNVFWISLFAYQINYSQDQNNFQPNYLRSSTSYSGSNLFLSSGGSMAVSIGYLPYGSHYTFDYYTTNPGTPVKVMLYDLSNYFEYYDGDGDYGSYDSLLYSSSSSGSSTYEFIYTVDNYYIIFENNQANDCHLYYNIYTYPTNSYFGNIRIPLISYIIIGSVVTANVAVVVIILIVRAVRKNNTRPYKPNYAYQATKSISQQAPELTYRKPELQKIGVTYCRFCGDKTTSDASFCPKCGSKL